MDELKFKIFTLKLIYSLKVDIAQTNPESLNPVSTTTKIT